MTFAVLCVLLAAAMPASCWAWRLPMAPQSVALVSSRCLSAHTHRHSIDMRVSSIESTPNPQSFLLRLDSPLCGLEGVKGLRGRTFQASNPPPTLAGVLIVDGVESVYAMETAVTVNKAPRAAWEQVLPLVLDALGGADASVLGSALRRSASPGLQDLAGGEGSAMDGVSIRLQASLGVPIQVEAMGAGQKAPQRARLPSRFADAMSLLVSTSGEEFFANRKWIARGVRYPSEEEEEDQEHTVARVLASEIEEIDSAYPADRLASIVAAAMVLPEPSVSPAAAVPATATSSGNPKLSLADVEQLIEEDGRHGAQVAGGEADTQTAALQRLAAFVKSGLGVLGARRSALAYLGTTGERGGDMTFAAIAAAFKTEKAAGMRRTAGDALSDVGDARAVPLALEALTDSSKLVRWRAARILGELGRDESVSAALTLAERYEEAFEVVFEMADAARRVRRRLGVQVDAVQDAATGTGPMWKQIQNGLANKEEEDR